MKANGSSREKLGRDSVWILDRQKLRVPMWVSQAMNGRHRHGSITRAKQIKKLAEDIDAIRVDMWMLFSSTRLTGLGKSVLRCYKQSTVPYQPLLRDTPRMALRRTQAH